MRVSDLKISISGIRGIVGKSLTPQLLIKFSEAFSSYISGDRIGIATDTRPSADMVKHAVIAGVQSCRGFPLDLGILPIPTLQIYTREKKLDGAISITASHNPVQWNALKLIKKGGFFLFPFEAEELLDFYYQGKFHRTGFPHEVRKVEDAFIPHQKKILDFVDVECIKKCRPKVVIDPCGGAAAPYVISFLENLGAEVIGINGEISGDFPRNPEPVPENIQDLCRIVKATGADIGFAQDADADRLAAVDENGIPLGEEYTLALAACSFLKYKQKSPMVVNLSTSKVMEDIASKEGVELYRSKVGEINVTRLMIEKKAKFGGEGNGGVIASEIHTCRDSFTGMALLLEFLARSGKKISELRAELPSYFMIKSKKKASYREGKQILNRIRQEFQGGEINVQDGLRVVYPEFWFHLRPSNTEPVVRILVESSQKQTAYEIFDRLSTLISA
ncbi:MAG: phosphoglucosamine mutase [Candidatus Aminicenantes bacterium]|nr:phosphoglucosamine mutase [Candidatus Aminicenantes bacterium]